MVDEIRNPRAMFERTACDCEQCVTCCVHIPGSLIPGDLERIAEHLGREPDTRFKTEFFNASDGAKIIVWDESGAHPMQIPTIVPKLTKKGCIFLKDRKCTIHEVAPFGCAYVDPHMSKEDGDLRCRAAVEAQAADWVVSGPYSRMWSLLDVNGHRAIPITERRAAFEEAFEKAKSPT